jgi:heat shock protein HtpX
VPNIYQNINQNKRDTVIVMVLFIAVVSAIGWFAGEYYGQGEGLGFVGFALIFSGISSFISYYNSDKIVLGISGAHEVKESSAPQLYDLVENVCIASGLPKPKIYMIDDTALNAFATGRDPKHSAICFTTGIVQALDKRELEGVIAHELSHIGNFDIRLQSIVSVLVGTITLLADWFTHGRLYGGRRRDEGGDLNGIILLVGIFFIVLSPIIATLIKLALSRNREYLADATAALITRYPKGLANALRKLAADREVLEAANGATAHMYIAAPLRGQSQNFLAGLFNTHPPIEERIRRLEAM